jgi:hypothetical protein
VVTKPSIAKTVTTIYKLLFTTFRDAEYKLMRFITNANAISQKLGKRTLALVVITLITLISIGSSSSFSFVVYAQQQQQVQS